MNDVEKVAHWLVVHDLQRQGYDPAKVRLEVMTNLVISKLATFSEDQLMKEWRRRLQ